MISDIHHIIILTKQIHDYDKKKFYPSTLLDVCLSSFGGK